MKQIETDSNVQLEAQSDVQPLDTSGIIQLSEKSLSSSDSLKPLKRKSSQNWLQKALTLAIAASVSATLGLTAALMVPLPLGLIAKDGETRSPNLWQVGLGYQVARPVNILIMGIDRVPGAKEGTNEIFTGRSDTMLLLRVDPVADTVSLLSIPRDTQVELPGIGTDKINDANVQGGATLAARTVSSVLNGVTIDRYVRVSTDAFRELVDLIGGVEVNVPKPMVYEDKTQKLKINLSPGLQTLNGDQAEQFARFRGDDLGDIGRVQRQQALLKALRKKLTNPTIIPRLPGLVQAMQKYIDTNLSMEEMLALVGAGRKLSEGKFKMVMLPGRFSSPEEYVASYWIMDPVGRDRVMKQYFDVNPVLSSDTPVSETVRIAIQNASGNPTAASQLRQYLAEKGFNDTYIINDLPTQQTQTDVIAQKGDLDAAETLQAMLGVGKVEADSTGDLESDVTIRIGNDWLKQKK
ncbi:MAG: LCP family protein [Oscillatoriales cyanobacterium C42_A2020_001]|nr:LCP family protein [Leptolyngbyaceae cyanobacterium C42_A2020_001]